LKIIVYCSSNQPGFRKGRGTMEMLKPSNNSSEKLSTKIQPKNTYYAAFLDVAKAFDKQPVYKDCSTN
jgi:hypothetical protein